MFEKLLEAVLGLTAALKEHTAALGNAPAEQAAAKRTRATKDTPPATSTASNTATPETPASTPQNAQPAAQPSPSSGAAVSAQDAGQVMVRVANEVSREAAVAILEKYGAKAFSGVKPGDYAAFKADCEAALAPKAAPQGAAGLF